MNSLELGMADKFSYVKATLARLSDILLLGKESATTGNRDNAS